MKICVISSLYKPYSKGGAERVVEAIVNGLREKGNEVLVVTTGHNFMHGKISLTPPLRKGGTNVIRFYPWNLFWFGDIDKKPIWLRLPWHIIDTFNLYAYFKIKEILKKEKPDVVMTHNLKGMGYIVPRAIRVCGIKHIHTVHDVQLVEPSGVLYQNRKRLNTPPSTSSLQYGLPAQAGGQAGQALAPLKKGYKWINKKLFGSPDIVISPSKWLMDFYVNRGFFTKSRKLVIGNPVPSLVPLFKKEGKGEVKEKKSILNKKGIGVINLLYIGQIEEHKGIFFLVNTIKNLKNIHLNIIGTGTKLNRIKTLCEDFNNIKIHGFIENKAVNNFIVQSDFVIVPSLCAENAPTVIYESFACGVPVIASNVGGIPELVKNGYNGYIFEAGN
ncbi:MAG: glycosyltransferase, partial [bacterium]